MPSYLDMQTKEALQRALEELKQKYGEWSFDIPLPFDIWTKGNQQIPHTRLKRITQMISDLSQKPFSECRILDLGCLDGIFSIEFAKQGAETLGIDVREGHVKKAAFCKEALGLNRLDFRQEDVRNISLESHGKFDAIVCSGILYHLPGSDAIHLIQRMYEMVSRIVVIDTHVALEPVEKLVSDGEEYWGRVYREYSDTATPERIEKKIWSSADNPTSFWFTRPSLMNLLSKAGFSSVYECFLPAHINSGKSGLAHKDRCTFVAIKAGICNIKTSPPANTLQEKWPENSLSYAPEEGGSSEAKSNIKGF